MAKAMRRSALRAASRISPWCALLLFPAGALGQLSLFPVQDLAFGQLQAGISGVVLPSDAARRAELEFFAGKGQYSISVVLPSQLTSIGGAILPLVFATTDGVLRIPRRNRNTTFDPAQPYSFRLNPNDGSALVYLGGTAAPALAQPPGLYAATITVMVTNTGN
jgi:hypothetical protein